jgi:HD-GYP domain-containing protein (c-di-GMP phosphodiesterase class II)
VELHHENWDGSGYPHGLRGEGTPLAARIVHVADAYDAMTSDRPYRRGMTSEAAVRVLQQQRAVQFDPLIVDVFTALAAQGKILPECEKAAETSLASLAAAVGHTTASASHLVKAGKI